MAESERPEEERQGTEGSLGDQGTQASPEAEAEGVVEPSPEAASPEPSAADADAPPETPGPAGDDAPAQALTAALEEAAEEVPASDAGPGEGLAPQPSAEPRAPEPPAPPEAPTAAGAGSEDVVPGAHLEPDLVLEERRDESPAAAYADPEGGVAAQPVEDPGPPTDQPAPIASTPMDLAADARYRATGKRKSSVARVILRPGSGAYTINGRPLEMFFPRPTLQKRVQQPLETAGYESRMDVVARIHGGGVSSQAGALRHGVARALVVADPNLRQELKRRGFLTRDARVKERKKAGLKKARKRPQFSKR